MIDPTIADARLIIFAPDQSIKPEMIENYVEYVHEFSEGLKREGFDDEIVCNSSGGIIDIIQEAQILATAKKISSVSLIRVSYDPQKTDSLYAFTTKTELYSDLSTIPDNAVLEYPCHLRIYVADGAFQQGLPGSLSQWTQIMADSASRRFPDLSIDVTALLYTEYKTIRDSAETVAKFIRKDLKTRPLEADEEIILLGHSQGAFILSYLSKQAEAGEPFAKNLPWDRVNRLISFDLPFNVVKDYEGPWELPVDLVFLIARNDPLIFPLLSFIFYPAGNDYLGNSDAYKVVEKAGRKEYRVQRRMLDWSPVNPTVSGSEVDNYNNKFEHDPFLAPTYLKIGESRDHNRIIREKLLSWILATLPIHSDTDKLAQNK